MHFNSLAVTVKITGSDLKLYRQLRRGNNPPNGELIDHTADYLVTIWVM